jgi:phosphoribosyl-ATP pyrophosphohydrolase
MNLQFLAELEELLKDRRQNLPQDSYTTELFTAGPQKILQKVGEEAIEYILDAQIAARNAVRNGGKPLDIVSQAADKQKAIYEGADLLYHFMVSLVAQGWSLGDVVAELEQRHKKS